MRITYDPEADALYIYLLEGHRQCRAVRLTEDIALDFTEGEKLAGIEVPERAEYIRVIVSELKGPSTLARPRAPAVPTAL